MSESVILDVRDLKTYFFTEGKVKKIVDGLSFSIKKGRIMGLVGTSGTGKSTVAMSILNLVNKPGRIVGGEVMFRGKDLLRTSERELQKIRGSDITLVYQDPYTFLDPLYTVGNQIIETICAHMQVSSKEAKKRAVKLLATVGIADPESRMLNFPHQFSGGMQQRVIIAMAIACNPSLIIMDDPTRSLDVTIQAQIISVLDKLQESFHTTMLLISASFQVVAQFATDVMTMFNGRCMEMGPKKSIFENPLHPYTRSLIEAVPPLEGKRLNRLKSLPLLHDESEGCVFYPHCHNAQRRCTEAPPPLLQVGDDHWCACFEI
jgi:oligopeptide/dipeptide ABC transporter ATP-binding protein